MDITVSAYDDLVGKTILEAFPKNWHEDNIGPDIITESLQKVSLSRKTDLMEVLRYDIPIRGTEDFLVRYWKVENAPAENSAGELEYVLHMVQDITDQVLLKQKEEQTQAELEKRQEQYGHFVDSNPDGLYSLDLEGRFVNANKGLAEIAGVPLKELLKMDFLPFCSKEDKEYILQHFRKAIGGETTKFEARFVSAKGRYMILRVSLAPMKSKGKIIGAYGITKDLTELRKSEKIIVEKRKFLEANANIIGSLLENDLEKDTLKQALAMVGKAVHADRIFFFGRKEDPEEEGVFLFPKIEWTSEKTQPKTGRPELQKVPAANLELLTGGAEKGQAISLNIQDLPEGGVRDFFLEVKIKSSLILPIYLKGQLYGLIGFDDCSRERHWSDVEINFLKSLGHHLTAALEKQEADLAVKKQEEALRMSEQKFRALVQEGADLMGILDLDGNCKFISQTTRAVLGINPENFLGKNILEFIHPQDQQYISIQLGTLDMIKRFKLKPIRFKDHEGNWRWLETTVTNLTDDPSVQGVVVNSRDITRLKDQEREIKEINERYQLAATATQDLIYDWDFETNEVIRFHKNFSDFLGHPISAVDRRDFWRKHIHPDDLEKVKEEQEEILNDPKQDFVHTEYRFRRADGSYAHFIDSGFIIRDAKGKPVRLVGASSDISDLKTKEDALKEANRRYKLAMKATKEMIWDWDLVKNKIDRSKSFAKISGYDKRKDFRQPGFWFSKVHPEDRQRVEQSLEDALKDRLTRKWREEYRLIKPDGKIVYIVDRGFIVRDLEGKAIRMVGSALDATESRTAIKRIKHQNRLLREIAWEQSHLVRAPLTRLMGLLDFFEMEDFEEMSRESILQHIKNSALEMDDILRRIVTRTHQIEPEKKPSRPKHRNQERLP